LLLLKLCGVKNVHIFINKCDAVADSDKEMIDELIIPEIMDLLRKYGFINEAEGKREEDIVVAKGSALEALNGNPVYVQILKDFFVEIEKKTITRKKNR